MIPLVLVELVAREGLGWEDQVNVGTLAVFIGLRPTTLMAQRWVVYKCKRSYLFTFYLIRWLCTQVTPCCCTDTKP